MKNLWKLIASLLLPQAALAVFSFNPANIGNNAGTFDYVRFAFQYFLPEGMTVGRGDVEALLCRTQDFLTDEFRNKNGDPTLTVEAVSIDWDNARDDLPVNVSFTALVTANGTDVPDKNEIIAATSGLDMDSYLNEYVIATGCPTSTGFAQATKVALETNPVPSKTGEFNLTEASCQYTCAPSVAPGMPTHSPTKLPTAPPTNTPPPKGAFVDDASEESQMRPSYTKSPSAETPKPVSAANPAYLTPVHLAPVVAPPSPPGSSNMPGGGGTSTSSGAGGGPAGGSDGSSSGSSTPGGANGASSSSGSGAGAGAGAGSEGGFGGSGASSSSSGGGMSNGGPGTPGSGGSTSGSSLSTTMSVGSSSSSTSSSSSSPMGGGASGSNPGGSGASGFGMGGGSNGGSSAPGSTGGSGNDGNSGGASPGSSESSESSGPGISGASSSSGGDAGSPGSSAVGSGASGFGMGSSGSNDGSSGGSSEDGAGSGPPQSSSGSNGFGPSESTNGGTPGNEAQGSSASGFDMESSTGNGSPDGGTDEQRPSSSNPQQSNPTSGPSDMVLITMKYGFFDGEERDPTREELKSLVCYTQAFFSDELQNVLNDPQLSVKALDIDWTYNEDGLKDFELSFAADVKHGNGTPVTENEVFQALKVADQDLHSYIVDYVSQIKPPEGRIESVFFSVNEVNFESAQNVPIPVGQIPEGLSGVCNDDHGSTSDSSAPNRANNGFGTSPPEEGTITSSEGVEVGEENGNMATIHIELGFFDGEYSDPTETQVEDLVCRTNSFVEQKIQEYVGDTEIEVHATNIGWTVGGPFSLAFAVQATFGDGMSVATNEAFQALKLSDNDIMDYLEIYVMQPSPKDVFAHSNEVSIKVNMGTTLPQGQLVQADCQAPEDKTPEEASIQNASPYTTEKNSTSSMNSTNATDSGADKINSTTADTASTIPNRSVDLNLSGVPGSSPNGALGDESSPNWSTPAPSDGTSPGDLTATDISAPAPGGSSAATPTGDLSRADPQSLESATSNQIDKYNLIMGFYNTPASQPTLAEVDALMCEAKKYFTEYLRNQLKDASLVVSVTNIGFSYNADCQTPMNVFFTVEASHSSGSSVDSEDIFRALRLGEDEILDIIQNYVWKSEPGTNVFRTVNQLTFESTLGAANFLPEGIIAEATCSIQAAPAPFPAQPARIAPLPLPVPSPHRSEPPPSFRVVFGFYDGQAREPTAAEIEALICQTNLYFEMKIQQSTGDSALDAHAVNIDWVFSPDCPGPVTVTFAIEGAFGDGESVPANEIFQALKLGDDEMREYLERFAMQSPPVGSNLFYNANTLSFEDMLGEQIPMPGKLAEVFCGAQPEPIHVQPSRLASFPVSTGNSQSDSENLETSQSESSQSSPPKTYPIPPPATSENAVLYHLEFHFFEGNLKEPAPSDIEALLCKSTEFFKEELQLRIIDACIGEALLTNIAWTYAEDCPTAPITVTFAARAVFCDGSPVPADLLYGSLQLDHDEIKQYLEEYIWKTEPVEQSLFYEVDAMTFAGTVGAAIRDGMMTSVHC